MATHTSDNPLSGAGAQGYSEDSLTQNDSSCKPPLDGSARTRKRGDLPMPGEREQNEWSKNIPLVHRTFMTVSQWTMLSGQKTVYHNRVVCHAAVPTQGEVMLHLPEAFDHKEQRPFQRK